MNILYYNLTLQKMTIANAWWLSTSLMALVNS